jgi:ribonuclease PH
MNLNISRSYGRPAESLRPVKIEKNFYDYAEGSCLISFGNTQVICAATIEDNVPPHLRGKGQGWVTGEYNMLPRSSKERIRRERDRVGGRTHEIQRLIGRTLRSVVNFQGWGERTITLDCDVLKADGGTRTASITGAFVAMALAFKTLKRNSKISELTAFPVKDYLSAISVGIVKGQAVTDLDYIEDSSAETDMNIIMTGSGRFVEIQGTAEKEPFSQNELLKMLDLGRTACASLCEIQKEIIGTLEWNS